jgi:hypothetical protein
MIKTAIGVLGGLCVAFAGGYFALGKWGINHETMNLFDAKRQRSVAVDLAVRRDYEMKAGAGYEKLPLAIISQGNTVRNTEYSFLVNVFAARGYLVASIQHDLPTDAPLVTVAGSLYVGRLAVYERALANILFVMNELGKIQPTAAYDRIMLVGHSNGRDISMFFAQQHPELVKEVVTLDNLRVPFVTDGRLKILSFRSRDPKFRTDPGVLPSDRLARKTGIEIVKTGAQHAEMSDRGPDSVKESIETALDNFLSSDTARGLGREDANRPIASDPGAMGP